MNVGGLLSRVLSQEVSGVNVLIEWSPPGQGWSRRLSGGTAKIDIGMPLDAPTHSMSISKSIMMLAGATHRKRIAPPQFPTVTV